MSKFIDQHKKLYKSLEPCFCPAIQEQVYFNADGLNHLLYKKRRPRNHNEQHYRMALIPHLQTVITNATQAVQKVLVTDPKVVTLWSMRYAVISGGMTLDIKVVLRKEGAGRIIFLSAMCKKGNIDSQ
jgi:hypothetical protein